MTEENELARLEGFVTTLLEKFNNLQADNKALNERIERRDATIEDLESTLATQKDERGEISSRVSGLIGQIEEWESSSNVLDETSEADSDSDLDADAADDSDEDDDENQDSAIQGNLFGQTSGE
jgi:chromosome segregation ATPase